MQLLVNSLFQVGRPINNIIGITLVANLRKFNVRAGGGGGLIMTYQ